MRWFTELQVKVTSTRLTDSQLTRLTVILIQSLHLPFSELTTGVTLLNLLLSYSHEEDSLLVQFILSQQTSLKE